MGLDNGLKSKLEEYRFKLMGMALGESQGKCSCSSLISAEYSRANGVMRHMMLIYFFTKQYAKTKQVDSLVLFMRCRSTDLYGFTSYVISSSNFMREIKDGGYF